MLRAQGPDRGYKTVQLSEPDLPVFPSAPSYWRREAPPEYEFLAHRQIIGVIRCKQSISTLR